ncbi:pyridoxal phosphate-dependent aminotransferase [Maridesulfovibrio hydrothermalis]|uniref:Aminotransferase n=1 Tax=Maridesulfovibrio hydrothermalis AM13 = DSM 14728 TaxID=1121451 RepID=L0R8Y4_9BACT|nr:pyridoxal phosphate-dependent aminotransferase [Maridesulfovibrio hydrothermalis]CCO23223.1 putative Aspartate aminotransferase [Maridesulfovibrio hydrothermalis AM13 = DSM 14728]
MYNFARNLPASGIRKFYDLANSLQKQGHDILHMEIGRPVWKIPQQMKDFLNEAMNNDIYHYMDNRGDRLLREVLCNNIYTKTKKKYNPDTEIIVTTGASEGLAMCALALLGHDDEVIIPEPAWPHYKAVAELAGAKAITVDLPSDQDFIIDPAEIRKVISSKTKMLVLNNPNNPTGAVQPKKVLQELANLAEKHGFYILADEVYDHFIYDNNCFISMAEIMGSSDRLIYLNSLSKTYSITGWRVGYVCCNPILSDAFNKIHQYLTVCGVSTVHYAVSKFIQSDKNADFLSKMIQEFSRRRNVWAENIHSCGNFSYSPPSGAFYLFPRFSYAGLNSEQFCEYMLSEEHICMVPGAVFGAGFDDHVRISFSGTIDTQLKAQKKLMSFFNKIKGA